MSGIYGRGEQVLPRSTVPSGQEFPPAFWLVVFCEGDVKLNGAVWLVPVAGKLSAGVCVGEVFAGRPVCVGKGKPVPLGSEVGLAGAAVPLGASPFWLGNKNPLPLGSVVILEGVGVPVALGARPFWVGESIPEPFGGVVGFCGALEAPPVPLAAPDPAEL